MDEVVEEEQVNVAEFKMPAKKDEEQEMQQANNAASAVEVNAEHEAAGQAQEEVSRQQASALSSAISDQEESK